MNLDQELKNWGPEALAIRNGTPSLQESQLYCKKLSQSHYENFVVVGLFTPYRLRPSFEAIYAYCRWADDLADETGSTEISTTLLDWWLHQLESIYLEMPSPVPLHPVFIALKPVVKQFNIPIKPLKDLLSAFQQDQVITHYATHQQLLDYCTRSANPVGELVLRLFDASTDENLAMSNAICTGLQLANFWQDVRRDLDKNRVYIPQETLLRFALEQSDLARKPASESFKAMLAEQVAETRLLFQTGLPLTLKLKGRARMAIKLFHDGGVATLDSIEKLGYDVLTSRPKVGKMKQLSLMIKILLQSLASSQ
ncbi:MAG: squalene synthase HpnC [Planctomycetota bacterium]|nr:squalene synthase HpnC [Planctomycetota bacterium]